MSKVLKIIPGNDLPLKNQVDTQNKNVHSNYILNQKSLISRYYRAYS
jgi:hypothetical protein